MKNLLVYASENIIYNIKSKIDRKCYNPVLTNVDVGKLYNYVLSKNIDIVIITKKILGNNYNILEQLLQRKITVIFISNFMEPGLLRNELYYDNFVYLRKSDINAIDMVLDLTEKLNSKINILNSKVDKLNETNKEIKQVGKAKTLLMEKLHLSEDKAHKYIQKASMDKRISCYTAATEIIKKYN